MGAGRSFRSQLLSRFTFQLLYIVSATIQCYMYMYLLPCFMKMYECGKGAHIHLNVRSM